MSAQFRGALDSWQRGSTRCRPTIRGGSAPIPQISWCPAEARLGAGMLQISVLPD
jgi:hypothetical protein